MQNTEKTSWQLVFKLFLLRKRVALDDSWMTMLIETDDDSLMYHIKCINHPSDEPEILSLN